MKTTQTTLNRDSAHHGKVNQESRTFFSGQLNGSGSFFSPVTIQPKLKIGSPDDLYERQADRVAEAVVSSPAPVIQQQSMEEEETLQLKCSECEEEAIQMKSDAGHPAGTVLPGISQKVKNPGAGSRLPDSVNNEMSQKMGADFSNVNIHRGPEASRLNQSLGARAFTHGTDVFFNSGEYNPGSREGKRLLAHELTHVVQQGNEKQLVQRDGDGEIEVDVITVPEHPGTIEEIVIDSFRTIRAIFFNLITALNNFETAIANESDEEARPKDPLLIALEEVGSFTLKEIASSAASLVPGGGLAVQLAELAKEVGNKIHTEQQRSTNAMARNQAANFIIDIRNKISRARTNIETDMTEESIHERERYNNATAEEQNRIRFNHELRNNQLTQMVHNSHSAERLFIRITQIWINNTTAPGESHESRVYVKLNGNWEVVNAYIQAPFGSRLGEQISNIGPLEIQNYNVPRVIIWYPNWDEGDRITNVAVDIPPQGGVIENLRSNITGRNHIQSFLNLIRTRPIPGIGNITGSTVQN